MALWENSNAGKRRHEWKPFMRAALQLAREDR